jgi:hypothetical protein
MRAFLHSLVRPLLGAALAATALVAQCEAGAAAPAPTDKPVFIYRLTVTDRIRVHQPGKHADLGLAEHLARELGRAVARLEFAQVAAVHAARAVRLRPRGVGEGIARRIVVTAHVEQRRLGALPQGDDVHAGRHREQDMANVRALAVRELRGVGQEMAAARFFGRVRDFDHARQQRLDRRGCRFADRTIDRMFVARVEQALVLGGLPEQFRARALAQFDGIGRGVGRVQRAAVHLCNTRCGRGSDVAVNGQDGVHRSRLGVWWPAGRFRRRDRTIWYGRNT